MLTLMPGRIDLLRWSNRSGGDLLKTLSLALLVFVVPLAMMPVFQGEGPLISTPLGEISLDTFFNELWDWIVEKLTSAVEWFLDLIVTIFETIKNFHQGVLNTVANMFGSSSGMVYSTLSIFMLTFYVLFVIGMIRVWVWVLDILPIA